MSEFRARGDFARCVVADRRRCMDGRSCDEEESDPDGARPLWKYESEPDDIDARSCRKSDGVTPGRLPIPMCSASSSSVVE